VLAAVPATLDTRRLRGDLHLALGRRAYFLAQWDAALQSYQQALALYKAVGARLGEANTLQAIGDVRRFRDEYDAALQSYQQALALYKAVGDRLGEANVLAAQGQLALVQEDQSTADRLLAQAITIYKAIGDRYSVAAQIGNYGWALLRYSQADRARSYLLQAADLFDAIGLEDYATRHRQAATAEQHFSPAELKPKLEQAIQDFRQAGDITRLIQAFTALREVCMELQDWSGVVAAAEGLLELNSADAATWAALADAHSNLHAESAAAEAYAQAVTLAPKQAMLRRNYANSLIALGRLDEAAMQLDTAQQLEPDAPYLALRRAELAKARQDRHVAMEWAQEALRRRAGWDEAQAILAWAQTV